MRAVKLQSLKNSGCLNLNSSWLVKSSDTKTGQRYVLDSSLNSHHNSCSSFHSISYESAIHDIHIFSNQSYDSDINLLFHKLLPCDISRDNDKRNDSPIGESPIGKFAAMLPMADLSQFHRQYCIFILRVWPDDALLHRSRSD